jgi:elongation factor 1-beta
MSTADAAKKAASLEASLKGKAFIGGNTPSAEDVKAFNDLLGAGNTALYRWVRNIASYSGDQRKAFPAPQKGKATTYSIEQKGGAAPPKAEKAAAPAKTSEKPAAPAKAASPKAAPKPPADDDDDDLFAEITPEEQAALDAKKKADEEKKKAKPAVIAKSNIVIDIKPWDDTTDLEALVPKLRAIERDGLLWGAHRLTTIAYGIKKLSFMIVIEDDKISSDDIEDMIMQFEDEVQSMDISSWNKV